MADSDNLRTKVKEDVIRIMAETLEISPDEITSDLAFNTDLPDMRRRWSVSICPAILLLHIRS